MAATADETEILVVGAEIGGLVTARSPDGFLDIADVISPGEILHVTDGYRRTAGFAMDVLHHAESLADRKY